MSPFGPLRPIAALLFFGRYWRHSRHRDALQLEGSVAIDPIETLGAKFVVMPNAVFPATVW